MFSGIVESVQPIVSTEKGHGALRISIKRPSEFNDIKIGDSIAINGVCLTVESCGEADKITFALAAETLQVLALAEGSNLVGKKVNLERSLRFGDRIHGHLVTGHVDSLGKVRFLERQGESLSMDVEVAPSVLPYLWKKGSVTFNGVSLTVNQVSGSVVSVCLIPETRKRTNLGDLSLGDSVNVEPDYMARALMRGMETGMLHV